jgi:hypothetical protein
MKKLALNIEELKVDSFSTDSAETDPQRGTVRARESYSPYSIGVWGYCDSYDNYCYSGFGCTNAGTGYYPGGGYTIDVSCKCNTDHSCNTVGDTCSTCANVYCGIV